LQQNKTKKREFALFDQIAFVVPIYARDALVWGKLHKKLLCLVSRVDIASSLSTLNRTKIFRDEIANNNCRHLSHQGPLFVLRASRHDLKPFLLTLSSCLLVNPSDLPPSLSIPMLLTQPPRPYFTATITPNSSCSTFYSLWPRLTPPLYMSRWMHLLKCCVPCR
jgi:hypothetical protein